MIGRRVWLNLAVFAALFVLLASWAVRNVVSLDRIERPYTIVAEFESSPGLRPNVEATYLGVPVGSVDRVTLSDGHVRVAVDIDRDVRLPEGVSAAVRRKSAVGEPYVALDPPPGGRDRPDIEPGSGYTIPLARTSVPLSYAELFSSVDELVSTIPAEDLGVVLHELATALDGRGPELRRILASAADVTGTLASRHDVLDELATDLTSLTRTLAAHRDGIGSAFDDLHVLTGSLAASRDDITRLLDEAPIFGAQVRDLLVDAYADLSCAVDDVGTVFREVGTPEHIADIVALLRASGAARDALDAALVEAGDGGADGPYLGGSFGLVADDPLPPYATRPTLPDPPPLATCDAPGAALASDAGSAGSAGSGGATHRRAGDRLDVPGRVHPSPADEAASSTADVGGEGFPLATALLASALVLLLAGVLAVRWRRRPAVGGSDSADA